MFRHLIAWRNSMSHAPRLMTLPIMLAMCFLLRAEEPKAAGQAKSLFDGNSLAGWKVTDFGGEGEVTVENGQIILRMGQPLTGITWKDAAAIPTDNFEI